VHILICTEPASLSRMTSRPHTPCLSHRCRESYAELLRIYLARRQPGLPDFNVGEWLTSLDHLDLHKLDDRVRRAIFIGADSTGAFSDLSALCMSALEAEGCEPRHLGRRRTLRKVMTHFHVLVALATASRHGLIELNAPMKLSIQDVAYSITEAGLQLTTQPLHDWHGPWTGGG